MTERVARYAPYLISGETAELCQSCFHVSIEGPSWVLGQRFCSDCVAELPSSLRESILTEGTYKLRIRGEVQPIAFTRATREGRFVHLEAETSAIDVRLSEIIWCAEVREEIDPF